VAGKKSWANKDKMATTILDGGKISVTDEAFAELCILNSWERWTSNKSAQWANAPGGNIHFRGWSKDAYQRFDEICKKIKRQRKSNKSKAMEEAFLEYATEQHSWNTKQGRSGIKNNGPELFNELADL
jgi:ribosome-associated translation inhibitor RaiA